MKKRFLLCLLTLMISFAASAYEWTDANGTVWSFTVNGNNATLFRKDGYWACVDGTIPENLIIPSLVYRGERPYTVTSIGDEAFKDCYGFASMTIPSSVTSIGNNAFSGCSSLTSITIPEGVTSIGLAAFSGCSGLTSITIPEKVTIISDDAFIGCSNLTSVTIPSSVTSIGGHAFSNCSALTSVTIPSSVTSIGLDAFSGCSGLTSMTIPSSVTSIGGSAFYGCSSLTSIAILEGVTSIGGSAFYGCSALTSVTIPSSVTSIGDFAFNDCSGLTSVTIPSSVTSIGDQAFSFCSGLTSVTIPSSVTSIGLAAFSGCSGLTSITIPENVTSIGLAAFESCSGLTSIYVDSANGTYDSRDNSNAIIETATNTLVAGCKNTIIPSSVTSIGNFAFDGCSGLTSVTIPSSVTSIGDWAFYGCSGLTSVKVDLETPLSISSSTFSSRNNLTLYVPVGSKAAYEEADYWKDFKEIVEWDEYSPAINFADTNVKTICVANWDTNGDGELSEAEAAIVTSLGTVFRNNSSITSFNELQYFTRITNIASHAFENCTNLISISIPANVVNIYEFAFYGCSSLKELILIDGEKTLYIKENYEDEEYEDVEDGGTYTIRCYYPAFDCSLNNVYIGRNISGEYSGQSQYLASGGVFRRLKNVTISNSVTSIDYRLFANTSLTSIAIPNSVKSIGPEAFRFCPLTSINIPNNVISIGDYAFLSCDFLTIVKLDIETPLSIVANTFSNRRNATLYVPAGSEEAYRNAPYWQEFGSIIGFINGDVNGDEEVDVVDVVDIARFVVGTPAETFVEILADINRDGSVNIGDAVALVNDIAGDQNFVKAKRAPSKAAESEDALSLTQTDEGLALVLTNQRDYTAFQFDLFVPEGTDVAQMLLNAQRKQKHQLLYNKVEEGHYRVAALSTSNRTFQGNDGELLNFSLEGAASGDVAIRNIHFFDTEGGDYMFNEILYEGTTTGIAVTPSTTPMDGAFYTIDGRRIGEKPTTKGLYIVNGKKVVIK